MKIYVVNEQTTDTYEANNVIGVSTSKDKAIGMLMNAANNIYNLLESKYGGVEKPKFDKDDLCVHIEGRYCVYDSYYIYLTEFEDGILDYSF